MQQQGQEIATLRSRASECDAFKGRCRELEVGRAVTMLLLPLLLLVGLRALLPD